MHEPDRSILRRTFLARTSLGVGSAALASLSGTALATEKSAARPTPIGTAPGYGGVVNPLHFAPRAKRVIWLCMAGGPSHLETFDPKPELAKHDGEPMPASFTEGKPIAQLQGQELYCLGPQYEFQRCGESGQEISTILPHTASIADDICIVRSMVTEAINHDPAHTFMNTGTTISGRPSMGSWLTYGLGSECDDLPGFVVLTSIAGRNPQPLASRQWHSGFLPGRFQGVPFHSQGDPVHYVRLPQGVDMSAQRDVVNAVAQLNRQAPSSATPTGDTPLDPEVADRISQYELAFKMQTSVPDLLDVSDEPEHIFDLYGTRGGDGTFASNCLLARRLAERGVRFIQLYHRGWDHHNDLTHFMKICSDAVDQGTAALVTDLKQRGMLDETLIVWGGEFGRTPMSQANKGNQLGRDHHMQGFSMWLAGGGIRGGMTYGGTDEFGYHSVDNVVHVHDLHATMLHLLGIDHQRLTYRHRGREFRLTDVAGHVVQDILA